MLDAGIRVSSDRAVPEDRKLALLLGGLFFLLYLPGLFWGLPTGKTINGALQILEGRIPYRDFWTMYAPGSFYLTAGVFALLGKEVAFQGFVSLGIQAAVASVAFLLMRDLGASRRVAVPTTCVLAAAMWTTQPEIASYEPALLFLLIGLHQLAGYVIGRGSVRLFWAGVSIGLAACFKHDVAAYGGASLIIGLFLSWSLVSSNRPRSWITPWRATWRLAAGIILFLGPAAAWVVLQAGADAWQDLIVFPATDYRKVRGEPYPSLLPVSVLAALREWIQAPSDLRLGREAFGGLEAWLLGTLPQGVLLLTVGLLVARRDRLAAAELAMVVTLAAAVPFFWAAAHVQQNTHLYSMAVLSALLLVLSCKPGGCIRDRRGKTAIVGFAAVYGVGLLLGPLMQLYLVRAGWEGSGVLDVPGARWIRLPAYSSDVYQPIARFLRRNTSENERIYVGVQKHGAVVINDPRFYYLSGRLSCCRYSELHPGVTDRVPQQREIIRGMERADVRAVVLWRFGWPDTLLARIRAEREVAVPGTGATLLDEYIRANFVRVLRRGEYDVLWRRDAISSPLKPGTESRLRSQAVYPYRM